MTPTPRTDAQVWTPYAGGKQDVVWASFARELECENARLRETLNSALEAAELDYKSAVQDYEEAQEQCVSCFQEHNAASYQKGIRDGLRNLLATIHVAMEAGK
jgi:hypothetical protein